MAGYCAELEVVSNCIYDLHVCANHQLQGRCKSVKGYGGEWGDINNVFMNSDNISFMGW